MIDSDNPSEVVHPRARSIVEAGSHHERAGILLERSLAQQDGQNTLVVFVLAGLYIRLLLAAFRILSVSEKPTLVVDRLISAARHQRTAYVCSAHNQGHQK
jgi:hypothetical protein